MINCQRLNLLLVFFILLLGHRKYVQTVQLPPNESKPVTRTQLTVGVNNFDYLPVAWDADYGFPEYDREKYPNFFDRSLEAI